MKGQRLAVDLDGFLGEACHGESLQSSASGECDIGHSVGDKVIGHVDVNNVERHALGFVNGSRPGKIERELGTSCCSSTAHVLLLVLGLRWSL